MWLRFGEGIGVERNSVRSAPANDGTRALLETYWSAVSDGPIAAGIAALYAYEGQVPEVAAEKIRGLVEQYGVEDARTLAFFTVHSTLDVEHSGAERDMILSLATSKAEWGGGAGRHPRRPRRLVGLPGRGERVAGDSALVAQRP